MKTSEEFSAWLRERLMSRDREFSLVTAIAERDAEHERLRSGAVADARRLGDEVDTVCNRAAKAEAATDAVRREYVAALEVAARRIDDLANSRMVLKLRVRELEDQLSAALRNVDALKRIKRTGGR